MTDLYAIGYPNLLAAEQVVQKLAQLQTQRVIQIDDAVIVERRGGDKIKLHQAGGKAGWAGLIGHVFSGSGGKSADTGITTDFAHNLGAQLDAGNVALVLLVSAIAADKVLDELHGQYSGHIMQTSLNPEAESAMRDAAERAKAAHVGLFD